jgi:hypothetical protein
LPGRRRGRAPLDPQPVEPAPHRGRHDGDRPDRDCGWQAGRCLIASLGLAAPIVIYFALGNRAGPLLERLKNWLAENNAVNMAVLMLIIGVKLIGDPITGLSS